MAWWHKQSAQTPRSRWNLNDYHTAFAATSKAQIEQGVAPWQTPWPPGARRRPENIQTGTPYRGSNSVYLSVTQTAKGYRDHRWATYKQIHDMGGQVRTGEQATHVLFYKFDDQQEKAGAAEPEQPRPPMVRVYAVFNVEQADHVTRDRRDDQDNVPEFVRALIEKHLAIEDERPIFPGGARAVLLTGKPIYQGPCCMDHPEGCLIIGFFNAGGSPNAT